MLNFFYYRYKYHCYRRLFFYRKNLLYSKRSEKASRNSDEDKEEKIHKRKKESSHI